MRILFFFVTIDAYVRYDIAKPVLPVHVCVDAPNYRTALRALVFGDEDCAAAFTRVVKKNKEAHRRARIHQERWDKHIEVSLRQRTAKCFNYLYNNGVITAVVLSEVFSAIGGL